MTAGWWNVLAAEVNHQRSKDFKKKVFFLVDALDSFYNTLEALPSMSGAADQAGDNKSPQKINVIHEVKEEPFDSHQDSRDSCLGLDQQQPPVA